MGYVASSLSDLAVITSDNPRNENPVKIIEEITSGFTKENFIVIEDRFSAIEKALLTAEEEDIVLIAGKGHEQYQIFKDKTVYFDDRQAVKEILGRRYKNVYPVRDSPEVSGRL
jgi:UDP-N-acetylmuramoyl-L-alanyl-D-glutamate--2,6-diaminopimelate ligase